jgi:homoserine O-acetyltransferase
MASPSPVDPRHGSAGNDFPLGDVLTERGERLPHAFLRYRIYGDPALGRRQGWTLVFHDLAGGADVDRWWGVLLARGAPLDPARRPLLAANLLGSSFGSTGPSRWSGAGHRPFPALSPRDLAAAHHPLLAHLGIDRVALAVGPSLGGMVALEWARTTLAIVDRLVVIAAPAVTSPQVIAWHAAQRMAIEADPAWQDGRYAPGRGPVAGLAAARALASVTARSGPELAARFGRASTLEPDRFDVEAALRRDAETGGPPDAASYVSLLRTSDLHDLGDLAAAGRETAARVGRVTGVGINTDMLHPPAEVRRWAEAYRAAGCRADYRELLSIHGHEAYRAEPELLGAVL